MSDEADDQAHEFLSRGAFASPANLRDQDTPQIALKLPATSANLGPGFDALGLAMDFALHVKAELAASTSIQATGRNVDVVQRVEDSLILETYRHVIARERGVLAPPIALTIHNEIPLGMGCGSSAAALVAGVMLANHFADLGWTRHQILAEASRREGHPDNVAACVLGGLTASAMRSETDKDGFALVQAVSMPVETPWQILLAMPQSSLSTKTARALLPDSYSKADTIANLQAVALLMAAFATRRGDLLHAAMADRIHQPYRSTACPLLPALLPLAGVDGVLGVALSGAGPSVLLLLHHNDPHQVERRVQAFAEQASIPVELLLTRVGGPAELGV